MYFVHLKSYFRKEVRGMKTGLLTPVFVQKKKKKIRNKTRMSTTSNDARDFTDVNVASLQTIIKPIATRCELFPYAHAHTLSTGSLPSDSHMPEDEDCTPHEASPVSPTPADLQPS